MERSKQAEEEKKEEPEEINSNTNASSSVEKTITQMSSLDQKFKEFEDMFANLNKLMGEKLALAFGGGGKAPDAYKHKPKVISSIEAAKHLIGKKNIVILTGAGLSAASGIPTFRGDNGFWSKAYGDETDPTAILTTSYFQDNPQLNWQWHYDFNEIAEKGKPNKGHLAILKFQEYCLQNQKTQGINSYLITQNIDNYDSQLIRKSKILSDSFSKEEPKEGTTTFAFTPYVYEIHGNLRYMHCSDESLPCSENFYLTPTLEQVKDRTNHVPVCKECGANMKPHCMFFDENYNEKYYRVDTVTEIVSSKVDAMIVVGTALATNLARKLVFRALDKEDCPVIEVNMESVINKGLNLQVLEKSETALQIMFDEFYRLTSQNQSINNNKGSQANQNANQKHLPQHKLGNVQKAQELKQHKGQQKGDITQTKKSMSVASKDTKKIATQKIVKK